MSGSDDTIKIGLDGRQVQRELKEIRKSFTELKNTAEGRAGSGPHTTPKWMDSGQINSARRRVSQMTTDYRDLGRQTALVMRSRREEEKAAERSLRERQRAEQAQIREREKLERDYTRFWQQELKKREQAQKAAQQRAAQEERRKIAAQREIGSAERTTQATIMGIGSGRGSAEDQAVAIQRANRALTEYRATVQRYGTSTEQATVAQNRFRSEMQTLRAGMGGTGTRSFLGILRLTDDQVGHLSTRFRETGQAISVLHGPLGGIASRFRSFGMLLNGAGLAIAGVATAMAGLVFSFGAMIREFSAFESQISQLELMTTRLNTTSGQTAQSIEDLAQSIARSTLASTQGVRAAASQLLLFQDIGEESFERVLRAAQDLSSTGIGNLETNVRRIARALEDPRRGLTSLREAGIMVTRQQQEMAETLQRTGREAEAQALILGFLEERMRGAAEAQAVGVAGALDEFGRVVQNFFVELSASGGTDLFVQNLTRINEIINALTENMERTITVATTVGTVFLTYFAAATITRGIAAIATNLVRLGLATTALGTSTRTAAAGMDTLTASTTRANAALTAAGGKIGVVLQLASVIAAVSAGFMSYSMASDAVASSTDATTRVIEAQNEAMRTNQSLREQADRQALEDARQKEELRRVELEALEARRRNAETSAEATRILPGRSSGGREREIQAYRDEISELETAIERAEFEVEKAAATVGVLEESIRSATPAIEVFETSFSRLSEEAADHVRDIREEISQLNDNELQQLRQSAMFQATDDSGLRQMLENYTRLSMGLSEAEDAGKGLTDALEEIRVEGLTPTQRATEQYNKGLEEIEKALENVSVGVSQLERDQQENTAAYETANQVYAEFSAQLEEATAQQTYLSIAESLGADVTEELKAATDRRKEAEENLNEASAARLAFEEALIAAGLQQQQVVAVQTALEERLAEVRARSAEIMEGIRSSFESSSGGGSQADPVGDIQREIEETRRLTQARVESADAYQRMQDIIAGENAARQGGAAMRNLTIQLRELERVNEAVGSARNLMQEAEMISIPEEERDLIRLRREHGEILGALADNLSEVAGGEAFLADARRASNQLIEEATREATGYYAAQESIKEAIESTLTPTQRLKNELQELKDLRPFVQNEEDARGLERAIGRLETRVNSTSAAIEDSFVSAFTTAGDALADFVTTGKLDFNDMINSMLSDILRLVNQMMIIQPIVNAISSGGFGALLGGGGGQTVSSTPLGPAPTLNMNPVVAHTGGVIGKDSLPHYHQGGLAPYESLAVLKNGEGVFTPEQMRAMGNQGSSDVIVNIINQSSEDVDVSEQQEKELPGGKKQIDLTIVNAVKKGFTEGRFDGTVDNRYGIKRRTYR